MTATGPRGEVWIGRACVARFGPWTYQSELRHRRDTGSVTWQSGTYAALAGDDEPGARTVRLYVNPLWWRWEEAARGGSGYVVRGIPTVEEPVTT